MNTMETTVKTVRAGQNLVGPRLHGPLPNFRDLLPGRLLQLPCFQE